MVSTYVRTMGVKDSNQAASNNNHQSKAESDVDKSDAHITNLDSASSSVSWHYNQDCGFGMIDTANRSHKIKRGYFGVRMDMSKKTPRTQLMWCQSRYFVLKKLFRALADVAQQAKITMVLGYGTLLSYHRYQDIMPWDLDGDVYIIAKEMDQLFHLIETDEITLPNGMAFLLRKNEGGAGICDHPIGIYDTFTGFYIDVMRLVEFSSYSYRIVHHAGYKIPSTSYYPLQPCSLGGIPFHCPSNPEHFIGPPGRDYKWKKLHLESGLRHCPYYEKLEGAQWDSFNMATLKDLYGTLIDPFFDWTIKE